MSGPEILMGAALGAAGSAVAGGNPIKGALLGGATGGAFGPSGLFSGFGSSGGAALNGLKVAGTQAASEAVPATAAGLFDQGLLMAPSEGLKVGANALNPFAVSTPISETAAAMGGGFQLPANAAEIMGNNPSLWSSLKDYMPSGQALTQLGTQAMTPRPVPAAPAGGITAGRAPDMAAITELLKRRQPSPASLLSNYFG